jgi:hypothetical protein
LLPTVTFPKVALLGFALKAPAARAVPENGMDSGEFEAFETMLSDPVAAPTLDGEKVAVKLAV